MSTRAIARIRRKEPLLEGTGRMRRARIIVPMALSVTGWKGTGVSFPSSGTGGRSTTAPPTSQRMVQRGARLVSGGKIERQFVAVWRTARLPVIMVPVHTRTAPVTLLSRAAVATAALQSDPADLGRATATATLTADMDSNAGTVTVPSSGQITTPEQIAATTLNFPTRGKLPAGTMVANMNLGKPSQLWTVATTVSVSQEKLSALKRRVMEVMAASAEL